MQSKNLMLWSTYNFYWLHNFLTTNISIQVNRWLSMVYSFVHKERSEMISRPVSLWIIDLRKKGCCWKYLKYLGCKEKRYYLFTKSIPIFARLRQKQTFCPNKTKAESLLTQWPNTLTYLDIFFFKKSCRIYTRWQNL